MRLIFHYFRLISIIGNKQEPLLRSFHHSPFSILLRTFNNSYFLEAQSTTQSSHSTQSIPSSMARVLYVAEKPAAAKTISNILSKGNMEKVRFFNYNFFLLCSVCFSFGNSHLFPNTFARTTFVRENVCSPACGTFQTLIHVNTINSTCKNLHVVHELSATK